MLLNGTVRLGDVCTKIGSGATPRGGQEAYKGGPTALIRSQNIYNHEFKRDGLAYIDDHQASELSNVVVKSGDVLLNITGDSVARCCQVPADVLPARVNQHVAILRPRDDVLDPQFLHYVLVAPKYQARLLALAAAGATRNALTKGMLEDLEVPAFDLRNQKAIAAVLGVLDDKIEVNRRMNATLEAIARALFQSWFVDFDPVRAKLDRRQPTGLDPASAALFPNEFEDSELGPIPKGWRVGKAEEILTFSRNTLNPSNFPDELFAHYSLPAFDEGRVPKLELGSAIKSQKLIVRHDAVLLSKLNPRIPRIWFPDLTAGSRAVCSTEFLVAQPKGGVSREFLFCLFTNGTFTSEYATLVTGTTGSHQRVRGDSVLKMEIAIPSRNVGERFSILAKSILEKAGRNIRESVTLAAIRDSLLPKLLSGKLSILTVNLEGAA
jgi:type I restriction enzyme, S subunit